MKNIGLLFFIAIVGIAFAIKYLPWWALLLGVVVLVVIGKFMVKKLLLRLFLKPFQVKGAVLKGASAEVHSVTPVTTPAQAAAETTAEGEPAETTPKDRYSVDVTIRPGSAVTPFTAWGPGELCLVSPDSVLNPYDTESASSDDDLCEVQSVEVEQDGRFQPDEGMKFPGPQRLKLTIAVKPGTPALKFRYYFEEFGCVTLLAPPVTRAA